MPINLGSTLRRALSKLEGERTRIGRQIAALRQALEATNRNGATATGVKPGRRSQRRMSPAARKAVSVRMKAYWAKRKQKSKEPARRRGDKDPMPGRGRPFRPGQSGNPSGRPTGVKLPQVYANIPAPQILGGKIEDAMIAESSVVKQAVVRNSIFGRDVRVDTDAVIEDSVVMGHTTVGWGARMRRAIVDRLDSIPGGAAIGLDVGADRQHYHVESSGLVVVPRGGRRELRPPQVAQ